MLLCCQQMAASARWAYGEHQSTLLTMFDEVNVCVPSAVYSSWPLSQGAPSDTYGGNLFEFFSRERNKRGGDWPWDLGVGNQFERLGLWWGYMSLGGTANWGFCEKFKELQVRFQCVFRGFMEAAAWLWHQIKNNTKSLKHPLVELSVLNRPHNNCWIKPTAI